MGLTIPNLDRSDFKTLMEEAIARLPAYSGEWTEYNPSDPGITVLELLVWLADIDGYRINRLTEAHYRAFLKLLGTELRPSVPARMPVVFETSGAFRTLPAGSRLEALGLRFRTLEPVRVQPDGGGIASIAVDDGSGAVEVKPEGFYPFGRHPCAGASCEVRFASALKEGVDLYWHVASEGNRFALPGTLRWWGRKGAQSAWKELGASDATGALSGSGRVSLTFPSACDRIRCVLEADAYETPPKIAALYGNAVDAVQLERVETELGTSSGYASQRFALPGGFLEEHLEVRVGDAPWTEVSWLGDALPDDAVYMREGKEIVFGDGGFGAIPPRGEAVNVSVDCSVGASGNRPEGCDWNAEAPQGGDPALYEDLSAFNPVAAAGGRDGETVESAFARLRAEMEASSRAVTASDYEALALETPGTVLARASAVADAVTPNLVHVTVVPESEYTAPEPGTATLEAVAAYLEPRRLLTTRIEVRGPEYVSVNVQANVTTRLGNPELLRAEIGRCIDAYLHPLHGGKKGTGWAFGADVYLSDLYILLDGIDGVDAVTALTLNNAPENVAIADGRLPAAGTHFLRVETATVDICGGEA